MSTLAERLQPLVRAGAPLLARWRAAQQAFDQRQPRERALMVAVGIMLVLALANSLMIEPAFEALRSARGASQQALAQREALQTDALKLGSVTSTQVQLRRAELAAWRQRARQGEALLRSHEDTLVGPDQMLALLDQVLARHGQVRVRAMRSLDRVDLLAQVPGLAPQPLAPPAGTLPTMPANAAVADLPGTRGGKADAPAAAGGQSLYRHGVELVLEGGFNDLLAYVQALEAMPQHLLWGGMSLKVQQHPTSLLTLRLYTVSRDRHWLEI